MKNHSIDITPTDPHARQNGEQQHADISQPTALTLEDQAEASSEGYKHVDIHTALALNTLREVVSLLEQGVPPKFVSGTVSRLVQASAEIITWLVRRDEEGSHTPAHHKNNDDDDRPEPFATVLEIIGEHSMSEVLESISESALFDSEDEEINDTTRVLAARWHEELKQVLDRMDQFQRQLTDEVNQFLRNHAEEAEAKNNPFLPPEQPKQK